MPTFLFAIQTVGTLSLCPSYIPYEDCHHRRRRV